MSKPDTAEYLDWAVILAGGVFVTGFGAGGYPCGRMRRRAGDAATAGGRHRDEGLGRSDGAALMRRRFFPNPKG